MPEALAAGRLDVAVVAAGLAPTRSRASDLIKRGFVLVDGAVVTKLNAGVRAGAVLSLAVDAPDFVSRGGEKLAAALDRFGFDVSGCVALDVGASTGGFTDVLVRRGARTVYAVDVGTGQLHERLRAEPRVVNLERTDGRALDRTRVPDAVDVIVTDVSFVSVTKVLAPALELAGPRAKLVILIKPQFEAGPENVGKGGIVASPQAREAAVEAVRAWISDAMSWRVVGICPSPIAGGDGNEEFLLGAERDD